MTVRWGFLGAGRIARHLAWEVSRLPGSEVVAVGASSVQRAASLGVGRPGTYADVLRAADVDVVYVAVANHLHVPLVREALAAGRHVLCEKPLGVSAAEVASIDPGDRLLVEARMWRWHPRVAVVAAHLPRIGAVEHVSAGFRFAGVGADDYRLRPELGGGASLDVGGYPVSAALLYGGPCVEVSARARRAPTGVDLATSYLVEHASGATSQLEASMADPPAQWLVVTGARGEIEVRGEPYTGGGQVLVSDGTSTEVLEVPGSPYAAMVAAVADRVAGGRSWVVPLAETLAVAEVLDAAATSAASGSPVRL